MQKRREAVLDFMASVEAQTKDFLSRIKQIDSDAIQKQAQYHQLATSIIRSRQHPQLASPNAFIKTDLIVDPEAPMMGELEQLAKQIREMLGEKVLISRRLYNMLADSCEEFDEFLEDNLVHDEQGEDNFFLMGCLGNEQTSGIILECQAKELQLMCVCNGKEESAAMIKCDSKECKGRWFHLKCVGIKPSRVPEGSWICSGCRKR